MQPFDIYNDLYRRSTLINCCIRLGLLFCMTRRLMHRLVKLNNTVIIYTADFRLMLRSK